MRKWLILALLLPLYTQAQAQSLPDAPKDNREFWAAVGLTAISMSADGYTTSLIRPHYLRERGTPGYHPCYEEGGEPLLFGKEPTIHRIILGSAMQFSVMAGSSYLIHRSHRSILHYLAYSPLILQNAWSWHGFASGLEQC